MPDLYDAAQSFRDQLLARDRERAKELIDAYAKAWVEIRGAVARLTAQIEARRQSGEDVPVSWLFDQDRLARIERQVAIAVDQVAHRADIVLTSEQGVVVEMAQDHTAEVLGASGIAASDIFATLPTDAVESLVGFAGNGSPLRVLLDDLGPDASARVRSALISGVAAGQSVTDIARLTRTAVAGNMARALLIARTEVLRSYREAAHQVRLANADVLAGWIRLASLSARTCAACLALHGTFHPLTERLHEHPAGRCVAMPLVTGQEFDGELGPDWFERQGPATQAEVLGGAGAAAYRAGAVTLEDFVGTARSKEWGPHQYAKSLRRVLGVRRAHEWVKKEVTA